MTAISLSVKESVLAHWPFFILYENKFVEDMQVMEKFHLFIIIIFLIALIDYIIVYKDLYKKLIKLDFNKKNITPFFISHILFFE